MKNSNPTRAALAALAFAWAPGLWAAGVDVDASNPVNFETAWDGAGSNVNLMACASGDLSGDGNPDLVLMEPSGSSLGRSLNGVVYVVYGPTGGQGVVKPIGTTFDARVDGAATNDQLNACWVWDLNNDGQEDLMVHAGGGSGPNYTNLYVLYGPLTSAATNYDLGDSSRYNVKIQRPDVNWGDPFPFTAEVNGDGVDDLILEAPLGDSPSGDSGDLYIIYGGPSGSGGGWPTGTGNVKDLSQTSAWNVRIQGPSASSGFGGNVNGGNYHNYRSPSTAVGDLNGDGTMDLAIPAWFGDTLSRADNGAVWVTTGPWPAGTGNSFQITASGRFMVRFDGPVAGAFLGRTAIGDFNADLQNDLCISGPYQDPLSRSDGGSVWCVYGPFAFAGGTNRDLATSTNYNVVHHGQAAFHNLAFNDLQAVDLNNDGVKDLVFVSQLYDGAFTDEGALYVIYGGASWPAGTGNARDFNVSSNYNLRVTDGGVGLGLGEVLPVYKDMDGDGIVDLLVGGRTTTSDSCAASSQGRVAAFYGPLPAGTGVTRLVTSDYDYRLRFSNCSATAYPYLIANDFDRDGVQDLALTYYFFDTGQFTNNGRVFAVSVSTSGPRIYSPSLFTPVDNPTVLWDASPGATSYRFQLGSDPLFLAPVSDQTVGVTQASVSGLSNGAAYYARVKANNGAYQRWSPIVNFTVDTSPLSQPALLTPGDDSGAHPPIGTQTPFFDWTDASPE